MAIVRNKKRRFRKNRDCFKGENDLRVEDWCGER